MGVCARPVPDLHSPAVRQTKANPGPDRGKPPEGEGQIRRYVLTTGTLALTLLALSTGATAQTQQQALRHSTNVLRFLGNHQWMLAERHDKCWQVPWATTCLKARELQRTHTVRRDHLKRQLWRELPATNDWRTAVTLAQRVYPGTESWLLYISDREGGWGRFVMNHQGSGAGGWMQFMASTFYGYVGSARADFARRGFHVDPSVWDWHHPLGQALTAGYMRYTGRDGCHWCL